MKRYIFLLLFPLGLLGQNTDSLVQVFRSRSKPDSIQLNAMVAATRKIVFDQPDSAFKMAKELLQVSQELKQPRWESLANNLMALSFYIKGDYENALKYYDICLKIGETLIASDNKFVSDQGKAGVAKILNNIGNVYLDKGNYPKALSYYLNSLKTVEELGDKHGQASSLSNIGMIYGMQGNYEKSLVYLLKGLKLDDELGDKQGKANDFNNIGNVYLSKKDYDQATKYQLESLKIREEIGDKQGISSSLSNLGNICFWQGETMEKAGEKELAFGTYYPKSLEYQEKSLKYLEAMGDRRGMATVMGAIGNVKNKLGRYDEAIAICSEAEKIAVEIGALPEEKDASLGLYTAYKAKGRTTESLKYFERYIALRDTLVNEERTREITKNQFEFEYAKKTAADSVRTAEERKTVALKLSHEKQQRYALYGGLAIVLVFAGFMFNRFQVTKRQNKIIEHQKSEVETKQKEILDSIHYANRIQRTVLANEELLNSNLPEHFVFFRPKDIVSGDFYWATKKDNRFYLSVCDSTGHGVPGAFMSLLNINFLNEAINEKDILEVNQVFDHVRRRLVENLASEGRQDGMDGTLICFGNLNDEKEILRVSYAAANIAPVLISNGTPVKLDRDKMPIGKGEKNEPFKKFSMDVKRGDMLYLFTDGFADQFGGPKGKKFRYSQMSELFQQIHTRPVKEQAQLIEAAFSSWKGGLEQVDDVTVVGIRIR